MNLNIPIFKLQIPWLSHAMNVSITLAGSVTLFMLVLIVAFLAYAKALEDDGTPEQIRMYIYGAIGIMVASLTTLMTGAWIPYFSTIICLAIVSVYLIKSLFKVIGYILFGKEKNQKYE